MKKLSMQRKVREIVVCRKKGERIVSQISCLNKVGTVILHMTKSWPRILLIP